MFTSGFSKIPSYVLYTIDEYTNPVIRLLLKVPSLIPHSINIDYYMLRA